MNPQYIKTHIRQLLLALSLMLVGINAFATIEIKSTTFDEITGKGTVEFIINGSAGPFRCHRCLQERLKQHNKQLLCQVSVVASVCKNA